MYVYNLYMFVCVFILLLCAHAVYYKTNIYILTIRRKLGRRRFQGVADHAYKS